ncbi:hypothetical protein [Bacillus sp. CECT 9360]|uniref:hypothetical protein n=1 Tax=Bacillus sp. CECT 9360 TaxID=2845821 RepID=UPI001E52BF21|nr:hypothetical protein [Bacillus sp. CECT 9360]CAH0346516.1 hypothetical protein BCI9360_02854 [Bacillus sp. CECT 9360]
MEERISGSFEKIEERLEDIQKPEVMSLLKTVLKKQEEIELETGYFAERVEELGRKVYKIERKLEERI